jgi:hypothetical protein
VKRVSRLIKVKRVSRLIKVKRVKVRSLVVSLNIHAATVKM